MTDFTTILNRGHRMYIDKNCRSRKLGRCDGCNEYHLLIRYKDETADDFYWNLCNSCYEKLIFVK